MGGGYVRSGRRLKVVSLLLLGLLVLGATEGAPAWASGSVLAWGANSPYGYLGRGGRCEGLPAFNPGYTDTALEVPGLSEIKAISVGSNDLDHALALLANGEVVSWGSNIRAQLGDGLPGTGPLTCGEPAAAYSSTPELVVGLKNVAAIAAGSNDNLALLKNGTVMAWGLDNAGELGNGEVTGPEKCPGVACSSRPVAVSGLKKVTAIAVGEFFSLALLKNGTVMAWGYNGGGVLGKEGVEYSDVPVPVPGLTKVRAIAAGWGHALALLKKGTVLAWGDNDYGELGNGTFGGGTSTPSPVKGLEGKKVKAISAGREWSLAALTNGTAVSWGWGLDGQLGEGCDAELEASKCNRDLPTAVGAAGHQLTEVATVVAGEYNGLALLNNGAVVSWGDNNDDQLGDGHEGGEPAWSPVTVYGLLGFAAVGMGDESALALQ